MFKRSIFLLIICLIVFSVQLQATDHSGTITAHETWFIGSPHYIVGDLTIQNDVTLTIQPGCTVYFTGNYNILIYGKMIANGNSMAHIIFTSIGSLPSPGDWQYIYFCGADEGSLMNYCDVSYGGSTDGSIMVYGSSNYVTISYCTVAYSYTAGIYVHDSTSPNITNCTIQNNIGIGIYCNSISSAPNINNCSILNNSSYAIQTYADNVKEITGTMTILGNTYNSIFVQGTTVYAGTWLNHNVPYIIGGNFTVDDGDTLTISQGTTIKFDGNRTMTVYGALVADGTDSEHITFTSNAESPAPGDWQYVSFYGSEQGCLLNYCDFSYGGSASGNIRLQNTDTITISNCSFTYSGTAGLYIYENSQPLISNSSFSNNISYGIHSTYSSGNPYISDCTLQNNGSYAIRTFTNNLKEITGYMNITGNTYNAILAYGAAVYTGTWLNHIVPYVIGGNFAVDDGDTLTISQGTTIKFEGNRTMDVYGALVADGTDSEHITFTSNAEFPAPGDWKYIIFYYSDPGCLLNYCDFSYGGSASGNIRLQNTDTVTISNCSFTYSGTAGLYIYENSQPLISNSSFSNNISYGIHSNYSSGYPYISDCTMQNNGSYAISTFTNSLKEITGTMTFSENTHDAILAYGETVYTGTWLNHNVPYVIGGNFAVDDGDTLTISQGTTIKFEGNRTMTVSGALVADGTSAEHITFTSNAEFPAPGNWQYIIFYGSDPGCLLDHCDFSYGGSINGNIRLQNTDTVTISNCSFTNSGTAGLYIYENSYPVISNSSFSNNTSYGIHSNYSSGYPYISDCTLQNNGSYAILTYADNLKEITGSNTITGNANNSIRAYGENVTTGTWLNHGVPYDFTGQVNVSDGNILTIAAGDTIRFGGNFGMIVYGQLNASGTDSEHITITRSPTYAENWTYIYFYYPDNICNMSYCDLTYGGSSTAIVYFREASNYVSLDNCSIKFSQNSGLYIYENSNPSIKNCVITENNSYGIQVSGSSVPIFGTCLSEWNDIYNNGIYDLYNGTSNIPAEYIYWGTIDEIEINNLIYDHGENSSLGTVDHTPWTNAVHDTEYPNVNPDSPQNVAISIAGTNVHLNWSAVPGATSYKVYSSFDPYAAYPWNFEEEVTDIFWSETIGINEKKFYYVSAVN